MVWLAVVSEYQISCLPMGKCSGCGEVKPLVGFVMSSELKGAWRDFCAECRESVVADEMARVRRAVLGSDDL